jgi:predicted nuclease of restriction endonuclease-like (RecB) superfamily
LPWGHVQTLLDKLKNQDAGDWSAAADAAYGWNRPVLEHHIATDLRARSHAAASNFAEQLRSMLSSNCSPTPGSGLPICAVNPRFPFLA